MSKYGGITKVNKWRSYWNKPSLPNYTVPKTVYYDKLSFYLRKEGVVNYNFAMAGYLFEMTTNQANQLNKFNVRQQKQKTTSKNKRVRGNFNKGSNIRLNTSQDLGVFANIEFDMGDVAEFLKEYDVDAYDSAQNTFYNQTDKIWGYINSDEPGFYTENSALEEDAITYSFSKTQLATVKREFKKQTGNTLRTTNPTNIY